MRMVIWFAASEAVVKMGPFKSAVEAWQALVLSTEEQTKQKRIHAKGAYVWPEYY